LEGCKFKIALVTKCRTEESLGGSSPLCANYNISIDKVGKSKHNETLLRCESKERQHVSTLFII